MSEFEKDVDESLASRMQQSWSWNGPIDHYLMFVYIIIAYFPIHLCIMSTDMFTNKRE